MHRNIVRSVLWPYLLLLVLLSASVVAGDSFVGPLATMTVIGLAATKAALVVAEYVEVRGSAPWLVAAWSAWGSTVLVGLAVVLELA